MIKLSKKVLIKIPYPKLILLILSFYVGYIVYTDKHAFYFHPLLDHLGYLGTFLAGILFAYGFTAGPAAAALLINAQEQNLFVAGIIASLGAVIGNYLVFKILKISFEEEINHLSKNFLLEWLLKKINRHTPCLIRRYVFPALAGLISATPLPEEFSVALIAASKDISYTTFATASFLFNAFGVFLILAIGKYLL